MPCTLSAPYVQPWLMRRLRKRFWWNGFGHPSPVGVGSFLMQETLACELPVISATRIR